jgi:hypothetical protein
MTNLLFTNNIIIKRSTRMMIFIAQKYSPTTSTISSSFMFKRFMFKQALNIVNKQTIPVMRTNAVRNSVITVHKPDPTKMSHDECQQNPILFKKGLQHPTIGLESCLKTGCKDKICKTPCEKPTETEAIAHATHSSNSPGRHISGKDFKGDNRPQYGRFYTQRPKLTEPETTLDKVATSNVQNDTKMRDNLHMYEKFYR